MKELIKYANDFVKDYNKEDIDIFKDKLPDNPDNYPDTYKYMLQTHEVIDNFKLPYIDNDATPEEVIDALYGLSLFNEDFMEEFPSALFELTLNKIVKKYNLDKVSDIENLPEEMQPDIDLMLTYFFAEKMMILFSSAKKINSNHLDFRRKLTGSNGELNFRRECPTCGKSPCVCK
jgi:hypothetical protein